jgi:polyisoprenoid-binding protein YceI
MMRKTLFAIFAMTTALASMAAPETFSLESSHVYPHWSVRHMGFSQLQGRFNTTTGQLVMDREAHAGSVDVTIDANSLDSGHAKRDLHLKGPDFFNVAQFPTITYHADKTVWEGDRLKAVEGQLTLLGITRPVTLQVDAMACGPNPMVKTQYRCGFDASAVIRRSDFGMKYGLPHIGDEVRLNFEVEGIRN